MNLPCNYKLLGNIGFGKTNYQFQLNQATTNHQAASKVFKSTYSGAKNTKRLSFFSKIGVLVKGIINQKRDQGKIFVNLPKSALKDDTPEGMFKVVEFGSQNYWDERYRKLISKTENGDITTAPPDELNYDWFLTFEQLQPVIKPYLAQGNANLLNLGCGNSLFGDALSKSGYGVVYNIGKKKFLLASSCLTTTSKTSPDFSTKCIEFMKRYETKDSLYLQMDNTNMQFQDDFFSFAIDKGTTDAMLCSPESPQNVLQMYKECTRVIRNGGYFVCSTYGSPENRLLYLQHPQLCIFFLPSFVWKLATAGILLTNRQNGKDPK